jgi:cyclin D5, plant
VRGDRQRGLMVPVEAAEDWPSCAFSLVCEEDGADLGDGVVDDGELFSLYDAVGEDEEEYVQQLVFKEASFCSSSDSAAEDDGEDDEEDEDCGALASEDWFQQARLAAVKWILEVSARLSISYKPFD